MGGIRRHEIDIAAKHVCIRYRRPELWLVKVQKRFDLINRTNMVKTTLNGAKIPEFNKCFTKITSIYYIQSMILVINNSKRIYFDRKNVQK